MVLHQVFSRDSQVHRIPVMKLVSNVIQHHTINSTFIGDGGVEEENITPNFVRQKFQAKKIPLAFHPVN